MPCGDAVRLAAAPVVRDSAMKLSSVGRNVEVVGRGGKTGFSPHIAFVPTADPSAAGRGGLVAGLEPFGDEDGDSLRAPEVNEEGFRPGASHARPRREPAEIHDEGFKVRLRDGNRRVIMEAVDG